MDYREVWNSRKPQHLTIEENRMWKESGEALIEVLKKVVITDEVGFSFDYWDDSIHAEGYQWGKGCLIFIPDVL